MHGSRATLGEMNRKEAVPLIGLVFEIRASYDNSGTGEAVLEREKWKN